MLSRAAGHPCKSFKLICLGSKIPHLSFLDVTYWYHSHTWKINIALVSLLKIRYRYVLSLISAYTPLNSVGNAKIFTLYPRRRHHSGKHLTYCYWSSRRAFWSVLNWWTQYQVPRSHQEPALFPSLVQGIYSYCALIVDHSISAWRIGPMEMPMTDMREMLTSTILRLIKRWTFQGTFLGQISLLGSAKYLYSEKSLMNKGTSINFQSLTDTATKLLQFWGHFCKKI